MLHTLILAGGSGTRFWPLSRKAFPKQLLDLTGEGSLLQQTSNRAQACAPSENLWVATGEHLVAPIQSQLPDLDSSHIIVEPCGRNTAPCIGLAALQLLAVDPEAVMLVLPSDQLITPVEEFRRAVEQGAKLIQDDSTRFVLFGAKPTFPSTGFGYIERGSALEKTSPTTFDVAAFHEKPNEPTAEKYLAAGSFYWNCGIFLWRADQVLAAIKKHQPDLYTHLERLQPAVGTDDWQSALEHEFPRMPSISIDYAVLEKADNVLVIEAPFEWDDLGSWKALRRLLPADQEGNIVHGNHTGSAKDSVIYSTNPNQLIATIGLEGCLVVQTDEVILIARNDDEQALKELLEQIKEEKNLERYL
ncbi:Mannose-1-phosphate guanylyltransferase [Polystyrenella longa]|uniref:mannose-1-phosphate guanylyltransferase n=1 Tax=Polystyrenella longa TaxID=2528007 RepID=A0A518CIJ5_9PLAN|nr:mannose-1-phosphate guanylyltransferase [Polystyrenella longa]QDU79004.1 Mannose-1-phosphate guanylyltransferase [Polystyrenella longa]